jgi:hypothetical protein
MPALPKQPVLRKVAACIATDTKQQLPCDLLMLHMCCTNSSKALLSMQVSLLSLAASSIQVLNE